MLQEVQLLLHLQHKLQVYLFRPSQVTFTAFANVERFRLNNDNQTNNNNQGIANSFGSMQGFARNDDILIESLVVFYTAYR